MEQIATITLHNGHEARQRHNRRDPAVVRAEDHIDLTRPHENWIDIDEAEAYHRLFDEAQATYNAKQKRKDRKIEDYHSTIRGPYDEIIAAQKAAAKYNEEHREAIKAGEIEPQEIPEIPRTMKKPVYETIAGVYAKRPKLNEDGTQATDEKTGAPLYEAAAIDKAEVRAMLREFFKQFKQRNPNLYIIGTYYHDDEQGEAPHIHIDWIPVADGYARGMERQTALDRALQQQGITPDDITPLEAWTDRERDSMDEIAEIYRLKVIHPQAGTGVKHKTKEELHKEAAAQEAAEHQERIRELQEQEQTLSHRIAEQRHRAAEAAGEAIAQAKRRDVAKQEADRAKREADREEQRAKAAKAEAARIEEQTTQTIADYAAELDAIAAGYEADHADDLTARRALQALKHMRRGNGRRALDDFAERYRKDPTIPRIPEDEAAARARRGIIIIDDDPEDEVEATRDTPEI